MSLIDDLAIEVDRRQGEESGAGPASRPAPPGLVRRRRDPRGLTPALIAAVAFGALLVALHAAGAFGALLFALRAAGDLGAPLVALRAGAPEPGLGESRTIATPPAVSARHPDAERPRPMPAPTPAAGRDGHDEPGSEPGHDSRGVAPEAARDEGLAGASDGVRITRSANDHTRLVRVERLRHADALVEAGRIARTEGRVDDAAERFEQALAVAPDHRRALIEAGTLSLELGRPEEAIARIRVAREGAPRDADLAMIHARLVAATGDLDLAIRILDRSARSLGETPELHALAAALLHRSGDHARAIDRYETLLRRHPGEARWWMGLGISLEAAGRGDEALDVYRIASQLGALPASSRRWVAGRIASLGGED